MTGGPTRAACSQHLPARASSRTQSTSLPRGKARRVAHSTAGASPLGTLGGFRRVARDGWVQRSAGGYAHRTSARLMREVGRSPLLVQYFDRPVLTENLVPVEVGWSAAGPCACDGRSRCTRVRPPGRIKVRVTHGEHDRRLVFPHPQRDRECFGGVLPRLCVCVL